MQTHFVICTYNNKLSCCCNSQLYCERSTVWLEQTDSTGSSRCLPLVFFPMRFVSKRYIIQQNCQNGQIGTCLLTAKYTLVQLLALYTDPRSHIAQCYRQTNRQTDKRHDDANSQSCCVAIRSAKNECGLLSDAFFLWSPHIRVVEAIFPPHCSASPVSVDIWHTLYCFSGSLAPCARYNSFEIGQKNI